MTSRRELRVRSSCWPAVPDRGRYCRPLRARHHRTATLRRCVPLVRLRDCGAFADCLAAALWVHRTSPTPTIDRLFVVMAAAWLWTCVQVVPLPPGVARWLGLASVTNAERLQGLAWAGHIPLTISTDPGSTQLQILVGITILGAFLAARMGGPSGSDRSRSRPWFLPYSLVLRASRTAPSAQTLSLGFTRPDSSNRNC